MKTSTLLIPNCFVTVCLFAYLLVHDIVCTHGCHGAAHSASSGYQYH
jgi:hypothetical protein